MIPLSTPFLNGNEWKYVKECLDTGWVSSVGAYVNQFENMVAEYAGCKYGVAAVNGTAALHIALLLNKIGKGDYVIAPNITFVASINAIKYTGASPILIDIDPTNWQIDLALLEEFLETSSRINEKGQLVNSKDNRPIKAIMPVHVLGNICDMDALMNIASKYSLKVIEDATESLGSYYKGKHSGCFGTIGCFSFNGNKIITTGGGGVIITDNEELARKAKHLTTQAKSDPMEYYHDEIGYNYRLVNVLAAIGTAQMEQLPDFVQKKKEIDRFYRNALSKTGDIRFQEVSADVEHNCWLCTIRTTNQKELLAKLNENNIQARPFWVPMNQLPANQNDIYVTRNDVADLIYKECLSIPSSVNLTHRQLETVVSTIKNTY